MTIQEAEKLLELFDSYDEKKLKAQYRKLTKKYHPDACVKNGISESLANEKIREINNAYEELSKYLETNKKNNQTSSNQTSSNIEQLKQKLIKDLTTLISFEYQKILKLRRTSEIKNLNIDEKILEINNRYEKLIKDTIAGLKSRSIVSRSQINNVMKEFTEEKVSLCKELETLLWKVYLEKYFCMFPDAFKKKMKSEYQQVASNDFLYEVIEKFLVPLRDKDSKKDEFLNNYREQIKERIDLEMLEYSNYAYYDKLNKELEKLKRTTLQYLYSLIGKIPFERLDKIVQEKIKELKQKTNQVFMDYVTFLNTSQTVIADLLEKIEASNLPDIQKVELINRTKALVNIENKLEFDKEKSTIMQEIIQFQESREITASKPCNHEFIDNYFSLKENNKLKEKNLINKIKNLKLPKNNLL